jgi:hypothetical protein
VGFGDVPPTCAWYARTAPRALSWPLALLAAAGGLAALRRPGRPAAVLAAGLAAAYLLLSLQPTRAWLHAAAALPLAALLSAAAVADLRPPWLRRASTALTAGAALVAFAFVAAGGPRPLAAVASVLGHRAADAPGCRYARGFCPAPPVTLSRPVADVLRRVLADPRCQPPRDPCTLMVVGAGTNPGEFEYVLARDFPRVYLNLRSPGTAAWGYPYPFDALLGSDYLLVVDLGRHRPPVAGPLPYLEATVRLLDAPPEPFARAHAEAAHYANERRRFKLLRRVAPLTRAEAEAVVAALAVTEAQKAKAAEVLAGLER